MQSQDEALVPGVGGVELEHLGKEGADRRPAGYAVVLDVERVEGVVVPERGGEGAGALDPDAVVPEAEGLEGVVVPREGRGECGRALGPDVVLAEEQLLCIVFARSRIVRQMTMLRRRREPSLTLIVLLNLSMCAM